MDRPDIKVHRVGIKDKQEVEDICVDTFKKFLKKHKMPNVLNSTMFDFRRGGFVKVLFRVDSQSEAVKFLNKNNKFNVIGEQRVKVKVFNYSFINV